MIGTEADEQVYVELEQQISQLKTAKDEQEATYIMRKALNGMKSDEAVENILNMFARTKNNQEFVQMVKKQKFL